MKIDRIKRAFRTALFAILFAMLAAPGLKASPAGFSELTLTQPDGSSFTAIFRGDEFYKILKTKDGGYAITRDADGWWCYAYYDTEGRKHSSGMRIGTPASPETLDAARRIPYSLLAQKALEKRSSLTNPDKEPILRRVYKNQKGHDPEFATKATSPAQKHVPILLVQYKDIKFKYSKGDFIDLINIKQNCVKQYFNDQFNGKFEFNFDVSDIITLDKDRAFYGANDDEDDDILPGQMIYDACVKADASIDFSKYDDDNDGEVDNLFVFFAGEDEAQGGADDCIWSHAWTLSSAQYFGQSNDGPYLSNDGVKIDTYSCTSELARVYRLTHVSTRLCGIGTFCHEYSHPLGLPDLYDTDYEDNGYAAALWHYTAIMDAGNQNNSGDTPPNYNSIEREILYLSSPTEITYGSYTLEPINTSGRYLKIPTDKKNEYFLVECRGNSGWDEYIGNYSKVASGLLVYHIDKTNMTPWNADNTVNANASHQYADLIEADCRTDNFDNLSEDKMYASLRDNKKIFFPAGSNSLSSVSHPAFKAWSGAEIKYPLLNITQNADGSISFTVGQVYINTFPDAAIIKWEKPAGSTARMTCKPAGSTESPEIIEVTPYEPGKYSITLENLTPKTEYEVSIWFPGNEDETTVTKFTTSKLNNDKYPYIYVANNYIKKGDMPLRVINATDATSIVWTLGNTTISAGPDGYYHPDKAGTYELKATISYSRGRDIIIRKITINDEK